MSVTFTSNAPTETTTEREACLCAQMAPGWPRELEGLAEHANPACSFCGGSGVEIVSRDSAPFVNLCNANASALLGLLGLDPSDLFGSLPIADMRRAIIRARATFDRRAPGFTRESVTIHGAPVVGADGTVELRPVREFGGGLDVDGLARRLADFSAMVETSAELGATEISWA